MCGLLNTMLISGTIHLVSGGFWSFFVYRLGDQTHLYNKNSVPTFMKTNQLDYVVV